MTAGGCLDYATWRNNPQFLLDVGKTCDLNVFLTCHTEEDITPGMNQSLLTGLTLTFNCEAPLPLLFLNFCSTYCVDALSSNLLLHC